MNAHKAFSGREPGKEGNDGWVVSMTIYAVSKFCLKKHCGSWHVSNMKTEMFGSARLSANAAVDDASAQGQVLQSGSPSLALGFGVLHSALSFDEGFTCASSETERWVMFPMQNEPHSGVMLMTHNEDSSHRRSHQPLASVEPERTVWDYTVLVWNTEWNPGADRQPGAVDSSLHWELSLQGTWGRASDFVSLGHPHSMESLPSMLLQCKKEKGFLSLAKIIGNILSWEYHKIWLLWQAKTRFNPE